MGVAYDLGKGVAEDDAEAVKWFRKAAEQGHAKAQVNLGVAYIFGSGVAEDYVVAHMWNNLARAQGDEGADKFLEYVVKRMTKEQIAEAQKKALDWEAGHQGGE